MRGQATISCDYQKRELVWLLTSRKLAAGMATGEAQGVMLFDFDGVSIGRARSGAMGFAGIPSISR